MGSFMFVRNSMHACTVTIKFHLLPPRVACMVVFKNLRQMSGTTSYLTSTYGDPLGTGADLLFVLIG